MARKQNIKKKIEYTRRLKELKQKLKPYRNSQTVNLLRVITGSAGVNLNKYFETLENVLTGDYSHREVKDRIQTVVNKILENGEYACKKTHLNSNVDIVNNNLAQIYLKPNMFNSDTHVETESKANGRQSDIELKPNVCNNDRHVKTDSKANVRHSDINLKASVFGDVKHGNIDQKLNLINRINHLHINSCNETCYRVKKDII